MGVKHVVAVPASLNQDMCNDRAEHANFLIHGKYGPHMGVPHSLLNIHSPRYSICGITHTRQDGNIDDETIFAKPDSYPAEIVQPTTDTN